MMTNLNLMDVFVQVVDAGGFSAAAKRISIAKSAVSKHIATLEQQLGVRLLNRTTRSLSLTEAGEVYYQACSQIVAEAAEINHKVGRLTEQLSGSLRISCPIALGNEYLAPLAKLFADQHPGLKIDLVVDDHIVNMVDEGIDVAIRVGWLADSNLIAQKLVDSPRFLCASPAYLEAHGKPDNHQALIDHEWVIFTLLPTPNRQVVKQQGGQWTVRIDGRFKTNNALTLRSLLLDGAGIGVLSEFLVAEELKKGRLIRLMDDYDFGAAGVYAVYPDRHYKLAKVQLFIEFLKTHLWH